LERGGGTARFEGGGGGSAGSGGGGGGSDPTGGAAEEFIPTDAHPEDLNAEGAPADDEGDCPTVAHPLLFAGAEVDAVPAVDSVTGAR
jgi:hypothetical protein